MLVYYKEKNNNIIKVENNGSILHKGDIITIDKKVYECICLIYGKCNTTKDFIAEVFLKELEQVRYDI